MAKEAKKVPEGKETEFVNPSEEFPDGTKVDEELQAKEEEAKVDETAGTEEESEESEDVSEVQDDEERLTKVIGELHEAVKESLEKSHVENNERIEALKKKIDDFRESIDEKTSALEKKIDSVVGNVEAVKNKNAELEKVLSEINSSEAIRKSADLEDEEPAVVSEQGNRWNGAFSGKKFLIDNHR